MQSRSSDTSRCEELFTSLSVKGLFIYAYVVTILYSLIFYVNCIVFFYSQLISPQLIIDIITHFLYITRS